MGLFSRTPKREHEACVIYVYDKRENLAYYAASCRCGWYVDPVDSVYPNHAIEQQMAEAVLAHDPGGDTKVFFPDDDPPNL